MNTPSTTPATSSPRCARAAMARLRAGGGGCELRSHERKLRPRRDRRPVHGRANVPREHQRHRKRSRQHDHRQWRHQHARWEGRKRPALRRCRQRRADRRAGRRHPARHGRQRHHLDGVWGRMSSMAAPTSRPGSTMSWPPPVSPPHSTQHADGGGGCAGDSYVSVEILAGSTSPTSCAAVPWRT